jgi:spermidine/putrescine transport system ATP-binding protein
VTHDQDEALELSDRVAIMNHGRLEQVGTPNEVRFRPRTPFVSKFLEEVSLASYAGVDASVPTLAP